MTLRSGFISGQPIVESLTPWNIRRITVPGGPVNDWPPDVDRDRLDTYADFTALVENRPTAVFERLQLRPEQLDRVVLALALPELVCNVWADALWGENSPDITFGDNSAAKDIWDAVWLANGGDDELGWQAIFAAAFAGDGVEHVFRDDAGNVRIETISPSIYFPRLKPGSAREVASVTLAWEEDRPESERMQAWQVRQDYELEGTQLLVTFRERKSGETAWNKTKQLRPDGVDFLPFVDYHAKRWRGRFWGISEIGRNLSLFQEIDTTLSRIAAVLDYHGEPTLQVPASTVFGGLFIKGSDRVIGIRDPKDAEIARYIDMPSHVDDQLSEVEKMVDLVLLTAEIQKAYTGDDGGAASSGTALRLKLQGYMKKVGRYTRMDASRISRIADLVMKLSRVDAPPATYNAGSPLPVDDEQEIRILSMMLADGTISRKTYMVQSRRFDDVDAELEEIDKEQSETAPTSGFGLPTGAVGAPAGLAIGTTPQQAITLGVPPEQRAGQ